MFVASCCAFQDVTTLGIGRIHLRLHLHLHLHLYLHLHLQLRRANLTERGLLANPNTCISILACTNLKPRSSHSDLPVLKRETFSAIRASRHRSKYSKASVQLQQTTQSHDRQNCRLHSVRPGILRTAFLSQGSKALKRNIQPCPPSSHPSTRCSP